MIHQEKQRQSASLETTDHLYRKKEKKSWIGRFSTEDLYPNNDMQRTAG
jgi:hypothetical protein